MTRQLLRLDEHRGIHRIIMDHGPNALDRELMSAFRQRLAALRSAGSPALLVASAHPTLFCPGWDLKLLAAADRDQVELVCLHTLHQFVQARRFRLAERCLTGCRDEVGVQSDAAHRDAGLAGGPDQSIGLHLERFSVGPGRDRL